MPNQYFALTITFGASLEIVFFLGGDFFEGNGMDLMQVDPVYGTRLISHSRGFLVHFLGSHSLVLSHYDRQNNEDVDFCLVLQTGYM